MLDLFASGAFLEEVRSSWLISMFIECGVLSVGNHALYHIGKVAEMVCGYNLDED